MRSQASPPGFPEGRGLASRRARLRRPSRAEWRLTVAAWLPACRLDHGERSPIMVTCARSATEAALARVRAEVAGLRAANARLHEVIEAKDAQLAAARAALEAAQLRFAALSDRVAEFLSASWARTRPRRRGRRRRIARIRRSPGTGRCGGGPGASLVSNPARGHQRCARWPFPAPRWCAHRSAAEVAGRIWTTRR